MACVPKKKTEGKKKGKRKKKKKVAVRCIIIRRAMYCGPDSTASIASRLQKGSEEKKKERKSMDRGLLLLARSMSHSRTDARGIHLSIYIATLKGRGWGGKKKKRE